MKSTAGRRAFTRAELLVLALLAVVSMSMLAPALLRGRIQAQRTICRLDHGELLDELDRKVAPSLPGNDWDEDFWLAPLAQPQEKDDERLARLALTWLTPDVTEAPVRLQRGCNHRFHPTGRCGGRELPLTRSRTQAGLLLDPPLLP